MNKARTATRSLDREAAAVEGQPACEACDKCGLKVVRYELKKRGIVFRFCDVCYWGELDAEAGPTPSDVEKKQAGPQVPHRR